MYVLCCDDVCADVFLLIGHLSSSINTTVPIGVFACAELVFLSVRYSLKHARREVRKQSAVRSMSPRGVRRTFFVWFIVVVRCVFQRVEKKKNTYL